MRRDGAAVAIPGAVMGERLYDVPSPLIAGLLCVSMLAALEAGHRLGRRRAAAASDAAKAHVGNLQSSMLGILALLDAHGRREAALARHIPEAVLLLLYASFVAGGAIVGFAAGIAGHRPSLVA